MGPLALVTRSWQGPGLDGLKNFELLAHQGGVLGEAAHVLLGARLFTPVGAEGRLLVDEVQHRVGVADQLRVPGQKFLDRHALPAPPACGLLVQECFHQRPGRFSR